MVPVVTGLVTGAAFGAVLYKVGATRYSRIMGMLTLRDAKIMKFAFTAIATAATLYGLASIAGVAEPWNLVPRTMPFLGAAHVVGGILFGLGMGISGLCPGTCVAKAGGRGGDKKFAAPASVVGLIVGVLLYDVLREPLTNAGIIAAHQKPLTVHGSLGLPYGAVALLAAAAFFVVAVVVDRFLPEKSYPLERERTTLLDWVRGEWSWLAGGVVGGVLIVLATAQGGYLGFSGGTLAFVGVLAHGIGQPLSSVPLINDDILWRAALLVGVFPGGLLAAALSLRSAAAREAPAPKVLDPGAIARSFGAGAIMCLGAMIGGGCTTGAFISAWPTLSLGSFAMGGTFFVVSMATSNARLLALKTLDLPRAQLAGDRVYD
jgi:uncharacterized protein